MLVSTVQENESAIHIYIPSFLDFLATYFTTEHWIEFPVLYNRFSLCYLLYVCVHAKLLQSSLTLCNPMDRSLPGSSVHGIFRQESWSGLPSPLPGDLPDPGIEPVPPASPALQEDSLLLGHLGSQRFDDPIASPVCFNILDSLHYICDTWSKLCFLLQNKHQLQNVRKYTGSATNFNAERTSLSE